jgi:N utilization substance protein B
MSTSKRRTTRNKVLQALYAHEISRDPISGVSATVFADLQSNPQELAFAQQLVTEVLRHQEEIEQLIKGKVAHWELDRIAVIDHLLLRMGICELLYFESIPPKVTINESIEIAKSFSTEKSGQFINGILDAVLEDLVRTKALRKSGRGLVNSNLPAQKK